jgi:hypothetical protein
MEIENKINEIDKKVFTLIALAQIEISNTKKQIIKVLIEAFACLKAGDCIYKCDETTTEAIEFQKHWLGKIRDVIALSRSYASLYGDKPMADKLKELLDYVYWTKAENKAEWFSKWSARFLEPTENTEILLNLEKHASDKNENAYDA